MSGPATHYLVGQLLIDSYKAREPTYSSQLKNNSSSLNLGTMGPDFLFFNVKDWPGGDFLASPLKIFIEVTESLEEIKLEIKEKLEPIIDKIEETAEQVEGRSSAVSQMTALYEELRDILTGLSGIVQNYAQTTLTDSNQVFSLLTHPIQENHDVDKWWWFDTMHYRKSGEFAKQMYLKTRNRPDSPEHAFAMGYMSHVASDVVGHPFVNTIVGGPYRLHPKRHKLVESYQDVWNFQHFKDDEFCYSKLFEEFKIDDNDLDGISKLIAEVSNDVYKHNVENPYGNDLTEDDIKSAYTLWMRWFEATTGQDPLPAPRPYNLSNEVQEVWDTFTSNVTDFSELLGDINVTGNGVLDRLLAALLAAVLGPIVLALAATDFLIGLTVTLGNAPLRYFMSYIYNSIYDSFYKYRFALTLNGFAFPLRNNLGNNKVQHTYNPTITDYFGNLPDWNNFPKQAYTDHGNESHLIHPLSSVEQDRTTPCPLIYLNKTPDYYVNGDIPFEPSILEKLATMKEENLSQLHSKMSKECLGNAVKLTKGLANFAFEQNAKQMPNLSLDADRGMGYRCWKHDGRINSSGIVKPKFTDR